jgi:protein-tyrosine phosphatase
MRSILMVCVGNICRSEVSSAGLNAVIGHGADRHAVALMSERGIDISEHRARQLVDPVSRGADLILVMEKEHGREIEQRYPYTRGRVFRLGHFVDADIADPYRGERAVFESSLRLIEEGVDQWAQRIHKLF